MNNEEPKDLLNDVYNENSDPLNFTPRCNSSNIWLFNSAGLFEGNVKYLFLYVWNYRPDIFACYLSGDDNNVKLIKSLGYRATSFKSKEGKLLMQKASVYVNEQVKEQYPQELKHTTLLNLFHGVGLKAIERHAAREGVVELLAPKYIKHNEYLTNNQCFLTTSPFMEQHFKKYLDLVDEQVIRSGYPRCDYIKYFDVNSTFDHSIISKHNDCLNILYAPTYRDTNATNFLYTSILDIQKLESVLKKNNLRLIIKLHNRIKNDFLYQRLENFCKNSQHILMWNNKNDIYEVLNQIDVGIIDYSSIYYDLINLGVTKFIRYIFDAEVELPKLVYDYYDNTTGIICNDFNALIDALDNIRTYDFSEDVEKTKKIKDKFWSYTSKKSFDQIINSTLTFNHRSEKLPSLYSFDIFDTLLGRKCFLPKGIFFGVMKEIKASKELNFPDFFESDYPNIRMQAERNCREYVKKCIGNYEITFDAIFEHMADVYSLNEEQITFLKKTELDYEYENSIPIEKNVELLLELVDSKQKVILISDMYLPKDFICKLLAKADKKLAELPLYLSSDTTVQKSTLLMYQYIYKTFDGWPFKEWHHYGDNINADVNVPKKLGILTHHIPCEKFNTYEDYLIANSSSYEMYLIAALIRQYRLNWCTTPQQYFAYAHVSAYMVPYVFYCVEDALNKGFKTLYFIARDGYFLKKIADAYIAEKGYNLKTVYLYGSRRAWRLASQVNSIDEDYFSNYGSFTGVNDFESLLQALDMTKATFDDLFGELGVSKSGSISPTQLTQLRVFFSKSRKLHEYLLVKAKKRREEVKKYFIQNINFDEQFAFVEYWGRGYTQNCLTNILQDICSSSYSTYMYYFRTIKPSEQYNIRFNYTTYDPSLIFVEAIFANHPFTTTTGYRKKFGNVMPLYAKQEFDATLFYAMEKELPNFVRDICGLAIITSNNLRQFVNLSFGYFKKNPKDKIFVKCLAILKDSPTIYGNIQEFAPVITTNDVMRLAKKEVTLAGITSSIQMSLARSSAEVNKMYAELASKPEEFLKKYEATSSKPVVSPKIKMSTRERKLNKLRKDPQSFFADSKNVFVRSFGKVCLSSIFKNNIGKVFVQATSVVLEKSNK